MKSISSISDFPREFDVSKYAGTEDFGLSEWARNLIARINLWEALQFAFAEPECIEDLGRVRAWILRECLKLIRAPLMIAGSDDTLDIFRGTNREAPVEELSVRDYARLIKYGFEAQAKSGWSNHDDSHQPRRLCEEPYEEMGSKMLVPRAMANKSFRELIDPSGRFHRATGIVQVTIDLHAPTKAIVESTRDKVLELKRELGLQDRRNWFTEKSFERWTRTRVLPFLDLRIWALAKGVKITEYAMGLALFPHDYDLANPAERVRRTIRPLADELLTVETVSLLAAQVREAKKAVRR